MSLFPTARLKKLTEKEFQTAIIDRLKETGYFVNRVYKLKTDRGMWLTSTTLKGLPDVMAVGHGYTLWIEVKKAGGAVKAEQIRVLEHFAGSVETNRCWLVSPLDDLQAIANWIQNPAGAPRRYGWDDAMLATANRNKTGTTRTRQGTII